MAWSWVGLGLSLVGLGWVGSRVAMDRSRFGNGLVMGLTTVRLGSVFSVGPRRRDLIRVNGKFSTHTVTPTPQSKRKRHFIEVCFKELTDPAGASTPCEWRLVVNSGWKRVTGMEADEKLKFKKSIFKAALDTAVQGHADGVPGFVLGDLNIDVQHVKEMLKEYVIEIHAVGGQGGVCHFKSICTNCTAVSVHLSVRRTCERSRQTRANKANAVQLKRK